MRVPLMIPENSLQKFVCCKNIPIKFCESQKHILRRSYQIVWVLKIAQILSDVEFGIAPSVVPGKREVKRANLLKPLQVKKML